MLIKCSEITTMKNDGYKYRVCKNVLTNGI
nr:MAG TPA: hypothetical protein [Caudoviricetes sp.]